MKDLNNFLLYVGSKISRVSTHFTLANLVTTMSRDQLTLKKENSSCFLSPNRSVTDLTVKTLGSRKRKTVESAGLSLENHGVEDVL